MQVREVGELLRDCLQFPECQEKKRWRCPTCRQYLVWWPRYGLACWFCGRSRRFWRVRLYRLARENGHQVLIFIDADLVSGNGCESSRSDEF